MPLTKEQKQKQISDIKDKFSRAKAAVVVDYMGITVSEADAMRKELREADVDYTVFKNTLVKEALKDTDFSEMFDYLKGSSAFAISYEDPTSPARIIGNTIKQIEKMSLKCGFIEGSFFDSEGIKQMAALPSKEELIAKLIGSMNAPLTNLVRVLGQVSEKAEDSAEGAKPAASEEPAKVEASEEAPAEELAKEEAGEAEDTGKGEEAKEDKPQE